MARQRVARPSQVEIVIEGSVRSPQVPLIVGNQGVSTQSWRVGYSTVTQRVIRAFPIPIKIETTGRYSKLRNPGNRSPGTYQGQYDMVLGPDNCRCRYVIEPEYKEETETDDAGNETTMLYAKSTKFGAVPFRKFRVTFHSEQKVYTIGNRDCSIPAGTTMEITGTQGAVHTQSVSDDLEITWCGGTSAVISGKYLLTGGEGTTCSSPFAYNTTRWSVSNYSTYSYIEPYYIHPFRTTDSVDPLGKNELTHFFANHLEDFQGSLAYPTSLGETVLNSTTWSYSSGSYVTYLLEGKENMPRLHTASWNMGSNYNRCYAQQGIGIRHRIWRWNYDIRGYMPDGPGIDYGPYDEWVLGYITPRNGSWYLGNYRSALGSGLADGIFYFPSEGQWGANPPTPQQVTLLNSGFLPAVVSGTYTSVEWFGTLGTLVGRFGFGVPREIAESQTHLPEYQRYEWLIRPSNCGWYLKYSGDGAGTYGIPSWGWISGGSVTLTSRSRNEGERVSQATLGASVTISNNPNVNSYDWFVEGDFIGCTIKGIYANSTVELTVYTNLNDFEWLPVAARNLNATDVNLAMNKKPGRNQQVKWPDETREMTSYFYLQKGQTEEGVGKNTWNTTNSLTPPGTGQMGFTANNDSPWVPNHNVVLDNYEMRRDTVDDTKAAVTAVPMVIPLPHQPHPLGFAMGYDVTGLENYVSAGTITPVYTD